MHIHPVHLSVAKLLTDATFQVPRFQRNYAWTLDEAGALLKDLELCYGARLQNQPRHHFFGGVVTAEASIQGSPRRNFEVVDGQQRLATFLMLIVQLKRTMRRLAQEAGGESPDSPATFLKEHAELIERRYETLEDTMSLKVVKIPRLELSSPDQVFFASLLEGNSPAAERESHRLIKGAFDAIGEHLQKMIAGNADAREKAQTLKIVHEIIQQDWTVIHMVAEARSDAHMLFQVLNDRGVRLTEGELLRSGTLEALEYVVTKPQLEIAEASWNRILRAEATRVRLVLRWIYASQMGAYPAGANLLAAFREHLFPMMGDILPVTKDRNGEIAVSQTQRDAGQELLEAIRLLRRDFEKLEHMLQGDWPYEESPRSVLKWDHDRLRLLAVHLRQAECMPLLVSATLLGPAPFSEIVQLLERFLFRYTLVEAPRRELIEVLNRHAVEIRRDPKAYRARTLRADLRSLVDTHAPDDVFRNRLQEMRYPRSESKKPLKYLLMTLDHYVTWFNDGAHGDPKCSDKLRVLDFDNGTIEHIYAENSEVPDPQLEPLLDTLGNLTFLSPAENDAAGAKGFTKKKPYLATSSSPLNREIADEADWTAQVVKRRQERLIDMALKVFAV